MATVSVVLGYKAVGGAPVLQGVPRTNQVMSSSAASSQSTIVAEGNEYWEIACATALWVKFGQNPTAAAGDMWYVPGGVPRNFQAAAGNKVAVIDA